jgi:cytochrome b
MKKALVYDLPTRLFHGSFALLFLGAILIAKTVDDDSPLYSYHMLLGLVLALTVVLRIIWGFVGSRYARFSAFALKPADLVRYFRSLLSSNPRRWFGHNPASSWAALLMMGLVLGLATTGFLMTSGIGDKEVFEEVHELFANTLIVVVISHVAGVVLHMLRHRDQIGLSMIHGYKDPVEGGLAITRTHRGAALLFLVILGGFVFHLSQNYDSKTQSLNLFGNTLQLGESESNDKSESQGESESEDE